MIPAVWPRAHRRDARMLVVSSEGEREESIAELPLEIDERDVVVVNDAATLPALLRGRTERTRGGAFVEARLAAHADSDADPRSGTSYRAVLFGDGDARSRTEDRGEAPRVRAGDLLLFRGDVRPNDAGGALRARVTAVDPKHPRLVTLAFEGSREHVVREIFRVGKPIQYSYVKAPLPLYHVESAFAAEPWAFEAASAGLVLDWRTLGKVRERGAALTSITHAAGISSTGDASLDARLPLAERSRVSRETCDIIRARKRAGGRVIAIGTTVTRALESAATRDERILAPFDGMTSLLIGEDHRLAVVDAILTGVHVPGESHHDLLAAFQPYDVLARACAKAESLGFLTHEWGDTMLVAKGA